jgi:hypothetical protein
VGVKEGSIRRGHDIAKPKRKINERKRTKGATDEKKEKKERKRTKNNWLTALERKWNWRGLQASLSLTSGKRHVLQLRS